MLEELRVAMSELPYGFPVKRKLQQLAAVVSSHEWRQAKCGVHPIMHERVPALLNSFLRAKQALGSAVERALYEDMSVEDLVTRLLTKRPLSFYTRDDVYK